MPAPDTERAPARRLFIPAALFNFAAGAAFLLALPLLAGPMRIAITPSVLPFVQITAAAVIVFGWGYWQIANDPVRNRAIIVMGIMGKVAVVAAGFVHAALGNIGWAFAELTAVDLVFVVLFSRYLRLHPVA